MSNPFPALAAALAASEPDRLKLARQLQRAARVTLLVTLLVFGYPMLPDGSLPRALDFIQTGAVAYARFYADYLRVVLLIAMGTACIWLDRTYLIATQLRKLHQDNPEWPRLESNQWLARMYWSFVAGLLSAFALIIGPEMLLLWEGAPNTPAYALPVALGMSAMMAYMLSLRPFAQLGTGRSPARHRTETPPPSAYRLPDSPLEAGEFKIVRPFNADNAYEQGYLFGRYNVAQDFPACLGTGLSSYAYNRVKQGFLDGQQARSKLIARGYIVEGRVQ